MDTKKLRQKILDLAIHGKLVPQDPNDEPASVLLERIRAEKEHLIKEGKIKAPKKSKSAGDTSHYPKDVPFEVPEGWEWTTIGDVFIHNTGKALNSADREGRLLPYITTSNLYWDRFELSTLKKMLFTEDELEKCTARKGDLLVCEGGDIGRAAIWNQDYEIRIQNHIHKLRGLGGVNHRLFMFWLMYMKEEGMIGGKGIGLMGLSSRELDKLLIPLPPLCEQSHLVDKIDGLFSVVSRIEKTETVLFETVSIAKSRILDLAIHGKLVPQDPSDEPVIELLKRINPDFKPSDNLHYEGIVPAGWQLCQLSDLFKITLGQSPDGSSLNHKSGIEFHQGKICFTEKYLTESGIFTSCPTKCAEPNSLLCCVRAPVGVFNITTRRICIGRGLCSLSPLDLDVDIEYWFYALCSLTEYYEGKATGSTFKAISGDIIRNTVIAVPPKMEQKRIRKQITRLFSVLKEVADTI